MGFSLCGRHSVTVPLHPNPAPFSAPLSIQLHWVLPPAALDTNPCTLQPRANHNRLVYADCIPRRPSSPAVSANHCSVLQCQLFLCGVSTSSRRRRNGFGSLGRLGRELTAYLPTAGHSSGTSDSVEVTGVLQTLTSLRRTFLAACCHSDGGTRRASPGALMGNHVIPSAVVRKSQ